MQEENIIDILIVGAGTAGLTAAIYGVRAGKKVLVLEASMYGGQIVNTPEIENYPGIQAISGYEFATALYEQAIKLGAELKFEAVLSIEESTDTIKKVHTGENTYLSRTVILATGAKNRTLGLEHEKEWIGSGISYCATCDGAFYRGKRVAVAGGGNTALEDAIFLSNYCEKVYLIHRRDSFRGEKNLQEVLQTKENVEFILDAEIEQLLGVDRLDGISVWHKKTDEHSRIDIAGLFIAVGQVPDNMAFANVVNLNDAGYICALEDCKTNVEGIFTAGDCRTKKVRQLTTAASDGATAALAACEYIQAWV